MYYIKSALLKALYVTTLLILLCTESIACSFPDIYIHHHGYPLDTDIDGGPNTWFNPMIKGQYDGCGLGISDRSNFSVRGGDTHSTHVFKYYAIIGNSKHTCDNYNVYGDDHPITKRYQDICNHSASRKAPGICLIYESQALTWAFSDCVTKLSRKQKYVNMDQEYPAMDALMDLDHCISHSLTGGIADYPQKGTKACFPFPLPPSPPPFCSNQISSAPQTPLFLPVCNEKYTNADLCGEPVNTGYSTYSKPCARVTFEKHISMPSSINYTTRLLPLCSEKPNDPGCITISQNDANSISSHALASIDDTGYLEAIYTKTVQSTKTQTRWTSAPQVTPLQFYGYNLAEFQDLCFDFSKQNGSSQSIITDNYGSSRIFRTCTSEDDSGSYCIEEQIGNTSGNTCSSSSPYCFSRPNMDKPQVTFCDSNNAINNLNNYCMSVTTNGKNFIFNKNQKAQSSFRSMETNNNYDAPTSSDGTMCIPYYDKNNNKYTKTGNTPCQYYGGLHYSGSTYKSGANKFCLVGYESSDPTHIVCTNEALDPTAPVSKKISNRAIPPKSDGFPLDSGKCCNSSSQDNTNPCQLAPGKQIRPKNPLEEGICVDIMPFEFENCNDFQASGDEGDKNAVSEQEAADMRNQCTTYQSFCSKINGSNNGYINADTCNKNYIDCLSETAPSSSVSGVSSANICRFHKMP
ncbi:MAG: hypothetical protein K0T99_01755 [Alphaproteobacteria bacterium]|nr:hypothetical protein [Alphaproteobacteria bacterium]